MKELPTDYALYRTLDIRERKSLTLITIWGMVLLVLSLIIFPLITLWVRPELNGKLQLFKMNGVLDGLIQFGTLLVVTVVMLVFHEGLHGVCFWGFTKSRPRFAFKGFYAYAAAPDWYLPKGQYLVTALAPLVGITIICLVCIAFVNASWILALLWMLTLNTSGAVGDLWVVLVLMRSPAGAYARDYGDRVEIYTK
jgi:hypothetical protein